MFQAQGSPLSWDSIPPVGCCTRIRRRIIPQRGQFSAPLSCWISRTACRSRRHHRRIGTAAVLRGSTSGRQQLSFGWRLLRRTAHIPSPLPSAVDHHESPAVRSRRLAWPSRQVPAVSMTIAHHSATRRQRGPAARRTRARRDRPRQRFRIVRKDRQRDAANIPGASAHQCALLSVAFCEHVAGERNT